MEDRIRLGISIGSRIIGFAVMVRDDLEHWQVKSFRDTWSKTKCFIICTEIKKIIEKYRIGKVSIKLPNTISAAVKELLSSVKSLLAKLLVAHTLHSLDDIKEKWGREASNKTQLARLVSQKYPFLKPIHERHQVNRTAYYTKLFEAVATVSAFV